MGYKVFVRVALYRRVMRFYRKDKLAPRFMGPFEVVEHVVKVAFRLALLVSIYHINNMFYVLVLHKYINDCTYVLSVRNIKLEDDLVYEEHLVQILDQ